MIRREIRDSRPASKPSGLDDRVVDPAEAAAWVDLALAMLNCNEFLYIP